MSELIYTLILTHITIICVTLYLHRGQAHKGLIFHPVLEHFMRFWLWLTTGMVTKQWVAIHRKHHRYTEEPGDPHSPHVFGIWRVFLKGAFLYHEASKDKDMVEQYGVGCPNDYIERTLYVPHSRLGVTSLLGINCLIFGWTGVIVWAIQMIWIPFWAAGVVNGIGHWFGYRNTNTRDKSKNIVPWGIVIGGEELHNNHHNDPGAVKLSEKWWEFDIGWLYIQLFKALHLVRLRNA